MKSFDVLNALFWSVMALSIFMVVVIVLTPLHKKKSSQGGWWKKCGATLWTRLRSQEIARLKVLLLLIIGGVMSVALTYAGKHNCSLDIGITTCSLIFDAFAQVILMYAAGIAAVFIGHGYGHAVEKDEGDEQ